MIELYYHSKEDPNCNYLYYRLDNKEEGTIYVKNGYLKTEVKISSDKLFIDNYNNMYNNELKKLYPYNPLIGKIIIDDKNREFFKDYLISCI